MENKGQTFHRAHTAVLTRKSPESFSKFKANGVYFNQRK